MQGSPGPLCVTRGNWGTSTDAGTLATATAVSDVVLGLRFLL